MTDYLVSWEINIEADSPKEAAEKARMYACKEDTTATVFRVAERVADAGGIDDGPFYEHVETFDVRDGKAMTIEEADELDCR